VVAGASFGPQGQRQKRGGECEVDEESEVMVFPSASLGLWLVTLVECVLARHNRFALHVLHDHFHLIDEEERLNAFLTQCFNPPL
jgi:hypothetical protein